MKTQAMQAAAKAATIATNYAAKSVPSTAVEKLDLILAKAAKVDKMSPAAFTGNAKQEALDEIYAAYAVVQDKAGTHQLKAFGNSVDAMDYAINMGSAEEMLADIYGEDEEFDGLDVATIQTQLDYEGE